MLPCGPQSAPGAGHCVLDHLISAAYDGLSSSLSTARRGWRRRSPPWGKACRSSAARSTSTGICSRMRPSGCMRRLAPTKPT